GGQPLGRARPLAPLLRERARRAHRHAGAAELAAGVAVRHLERRTDGHEVAALAERQHRGLALFLAYAHAAGAEDAEVVVPVVELLAVLHRQVAVAAGQRELGNADALGCGLQLAHAVLGAVPASRGDPDLADRALVGCAFYGLRAHQARGRVLAQHELQDLAPQGLDGVGLGMN